MKTLYYDKIIAFGFLWVLLVSMIDHYLTIKFQQEIIASERNPLGRWLIGADGGSVALFMTLKMFFLWVIALIVLKLYEAKKKYAYTCIVALSIVQLFLIYYFLQ